jgi:DNA polymerase-3 subunit alpha/error-prone DNA polymerase
MLCSKGHPLALSQEIYRQIESFAGTPFARHSASYAVESYQSLYLKVHYPRVYGGSYQQPRRIL